MFTSAHPHVETPIQHDAPGADGVLQGLALHRRRRVRQERRV